MVGNGQDCIRENGEVIVSISCPGMISLHLIQTALAVTHLPLQPTCTAFLGLALNINIISFQFYVCFTFLGIYNTDGSISVGILTLVSTAAFTLAASEIGREMCQIGGQILYPQSGHLSL